MTGKSKTKGSSVARGGRVLKTYQSSRRSIRDESEGVEVAASTSKASTSKTQAKGKERAADITKPSKAIPESSSEEDVSDDTSDEEANDLVDRVRSIGRFANFVPQKFVTTQQLDDKLLEVNRKLKNVRVCSAPAFATFF